VDNIIWKYKRDDILLSLTIKIKKMKKPLQKSIIEWYIKEHDSLSQLNPIRPYEAFVVEVYIDELMFTGRNTPSVIKQLEKFRNFIEDNYEYIKKVIANVTRLSTPFEDKNQFEKVLTVYDSYLQVEKLAPGKGDEIVQEFYNQISK
jgi:hypothetical protein